mmetsp:Transcript_16529/g.56318  ORF Transcript_16529/g.56318 Transcript_16529/m.56318 type:complete len:274 (+) Transcript_16529:99-920(+)
MSHSRPAAMFANASATPSTIATMEKPVPRSLGGRDAESAALRLPWVIAICSPTSRKPHITCMPLAALSRMMSATSITPKPVSSIRLRLLVLSASTPSGNVAKVCTKLLAMSRVGSMRTDQPRARACMVTKASEKRANMRMKATSSVFQNVTGRLGTSSKSLATVSLNSLAPCMRPVLQPCTTSSPSLYPAAPCPPSPMTSPRSTPISSLFRPITSLTFLMARLGVPIRVVLGPGASTSVVTGGAKARWGGITLFSSSQTAATVGTTASANVMR